MFLRLLAIAAAFSTVHTAAVAYACGCFSPPVPTPTDLDFSVNQESEQIIFEVGESTVTAHVLIRYQGDAKRFAWIVPVPNAPELALSEEFAFALLDENTRPLVGVNQESLCPDAEFRCEYHPSCPVPRDPNPPSFPGGGGFADAAAAPRDSGQSSAPPPPPVEVIDRATIGSYETITFAAGDAAAAVTWLQEEGFIVNQTTAPFMQPYSDAGMVFVAAKLLPGAGLDQIKPLRMTYQGTTPMVPLRLTAVGTQPELTVTSYIYADQFFSPVGHPLVAPRSFAISADPEGRTNYPMALSRAIDEAGGDAFVIEFASNPPRLTDNSGCCNSGGDFCGIGGDGACQCPMSDFDAVDCEDEAPGATLFNRLADEYAQVTRLTTRLNAEEMTFDPMFAADPAVQLQARLSITGTRRSLDSCREEIANADKPRYEEIRLQQWCATTYCGHGRCVATDSGAGCECDPNYVARAFTNLDGQPSITCVPDEYPVDFSAGGIELPDVCEDYDCGSGTCVNLGGFPSCSCAAGNAGALTAGGEAACRATMLATDDAGARDYSDGIDDIEVCWPTPPSCGERGWLVRNESVRRRGVACGYNEPVDDAFTVPPAPSCADVVGGGSGGGVSGGSGGTDDCSAGGVPVGSLGLILVALVGLRRRLC